MSRIRRLLTIHTSLGPAANYSLQATVPPHLLSRCSAALPRPHWEPVLYYSLMCFMTFLFICVCLAAYFEGDRIIMADIIRRKVKVTSSTQPFDKGKVFDLRNVAGLSMAKNNGSTPGPGSSMTSNEHRVAAAKSMLKANGHVEYHHLVHTNGHQPFLARVLSTFRRLNPRRLLFSSKVNSKPTTVPMASETGAGSSSNSGKDADHHRTLIRTDSNRSKNSDQRLSTNSVPLQTTQSLKEAPVTEKPFPNHVAQKISNKKSKGNNKRHFEPVNGLSSFLQEEAVDYHKLASGGSPSIAKKSMVDPEDDPRDRSTASEAADDCLEDDAGSRAESSKNTGKQY